MVMKLIDDYIDRHFNAKGDKHLFVSDNKTRFLLDQAQYEAMRKLLRLELIGVGVVVLCILAAIILAK